MKKENYFRMLCTKNTYSSMKTYISILSLQKEITKIQSKYWRIQNIRRKSHEGSRKKFTREKSFHIFSQSSLLVEIP